MAITFGTGGSVKEMVQWYDADTTGGWGGANDGLEGFGSNIEGTDCIVAALRKNENVSITYTGTLTSIPSGSQLIFNFFTTIAAVLTSLDVDVNDGASGTANFDFLADFTGSEKVTLQTFIPIALDLSAGTLNVPTNNLSDVSYNIIVQNVNIKAVDNNFWDAAYVGDGITLIGTTVSDTLFLEGHDNDITADIHNGVLQAYEDVVFAQHNIDINTTTGNSDKESLTFIETLNGTNSYTLGGTGTAVFTGTNIQSTGTVTLVVDMSNMTSFSMTSGSINNATTVTFTSGQSIIRAVFNDVTTLNTGTSTFNDNSLNTVTTANIASNSSGLRLTSVTTPNVTGNLTDCIINSSGRVSVTGGNTLTDCSFTDTSATTSAVLASTTTIGNITGCTFTRTSGTTNAIDIGDVGTTTSVDFTGNTLSGYGTQTAGDGISSTAGGAIAVNFTSNVTLTINVVSGSTIPTVEISGTGTVNIVASITTTISGLLGNSEIRVLDNPSPYSATTLPAPSITTIASTETVSANTFTGDGTNYFQINTGGAFVTIDAVGTAAFTDAGVLRDGNTTAVTNGTALSDGDKIRVVVRDDADNPTLQLFDEFEVDADPTAPTGSSIITKTASSGFTSAFGSAITGSNSKTVTVEKVGAKFDFNVSDGEILDFLVFRTGSNAILSLNNEITSTTNSFPISQTGDRNYRDPA